MSDGYDEHEGGEGAGREGAAFEAELTARMAAVVDGVDGAPSRDGVAAAVVHLQARQVRVRRAAALAAAAVLVVGGFATALVVRGDDDGPVRVAAGPTGSTTSTTSSTEVPGCPAPTPMDLDGIRVAYGYDWGIDLAGGAVRVLDRPFGPDGAASGLLVLRPAQAVYLVEDGLVDGFSVPPGSTLAARLTSAMAEHLAEHGEPVTADQLAHPFEPKVDGDVVRTVAVPVDPAALALADACPDEAGGLDVPEATTSTTEPATTTSTSTTTTSTTVPETTTTTAPMPPVAVTSFTEGGALWVVYLDAYYLGPDYLGASEVLEETEARLAGTGYEGRDRAVPLACDQGGDAAFPDLRPGDGRNQVWVVGLYFATEDEAGRFEAQLGGTTYGPADVRTTCVAAPDPATGYQRP